MLYRRHVQYSKDVFFSYTNAVSLGAKIKKKRKKKSTWLGTAWYGFIFRTVLIADQLV